MHLDKYTSFMKNNDHLIIFDTTLRDGEQSPGASMDIEEKLQIALALNDLNVDVIEAGFPIASNGDFAAVKEISDTIKTSRVCALARALDKDILRAADALKMQNYQEFIHLLQHHQYIWR